ncbi:MAG: dTMP kinase [Candidatus Caldarchaeum sp.]|nr:dTMP kinase [Candidatus Caldarchaeum sp.]
MKKPLYIAVEGIDGAGKTTQAKLLAAYLRRKGIRTVLVHEPSSGDVGRIIRKGLRKKVRISEEALALLFAADRLILREKIIEPARIKGFFIVSDRSVVSSLAYQPVATKKREWVVEINKYAAEPEVVVFIDISPVRALKRLRKNSQRYERVSFLAKVRREYLRVLRKFKNVVVVDGEKPVDEVAREIVEKISKFIPGLVK